MARIAKIDVSKGFGECATLRVRLVGLRRLRWRLKVGAVLIKLAAWVMGCGIYFDAPED